MKLYGFANIVEQQFMSYEYARLLLKPLCGYYSEGLYYMMAIDK